MEDAFVLTEARQQLFGDMAHAQRVRCSKGLAVLLHLGGAEQLRAKWRLFAKSFVRWTVSMKACPQLTQASDNGRGEGRQIKNLLIKKLSINQPDCNYGGLLDFRFSAITGTVVRGGYYQCLCE